jgi:hypothetical protein
MAIVEAAAAFGEARAVPVTSPTPPVSATPATTTPATTTPAATTPTAPTQMKGAADIASLLLKTGIISAAQASRTRRIQQKLPERSFLSIIQELGYASEE